MTKNNIKELSIQVNLNGLSFCILNRTTNCIEFLNTITFEHKLTPFDTLNRLKAELSSNTVFSDEFDTVILIHQNELATLVPQGLYDENHKADYLKFNAKILKTDYITHDVIVANNSVNVYIPYVNINNYIFDTFGEFVYKHSSTVLIQTIFEKASEATKVYLQVNFSTVEIIVVENGKLQLFNIFEYHSKEDFIYYVLFVFEQLKLDANTIHIELSGRINKDDELFNILYTYVRHVNFAEAKYNYKFSDTVTDAQLYELHYNHLLLNSF